MANGEWLIIRHSLIRKFAALLAPAYRQFFVDVAALDLRGFVSGLRSAAAIDNYNIAGTYTIGYDFL
jgi:hypothetical protein